MGSGGAQTLQQAINSAALTANLQLCLDAGDAASWPGSGTKWLDTSGNGYDFFLGSDGTTNAPTFTGPVGGTASYFAVGDKSFFRYDTANETWMKNIHKNNAAFSFFTVFYSPTSSATAYYLGDSSGSPGTGFRWRSGAQLTLDVYNAGATVITESTTSQFLTQPGINIVGLSVNEATGVGGGFNYSNGGYAQVSGSDTFDSTYSSPSSGNPTYTLDIGSDGNAESSNKCTLGTRFYCLAAWSSALTKANMDTLYSILRYRFGL